MRALEQWVQGVLQPDVTILFDVPVEVSMQRLVQARKPDKFERENAAFFTKIRQMYLQRAAENPARFHVIDANQPLEVVRQSVLALVSTL